MEIQVGASSRPRDSRPTASASAATLTSITASPACSFGSTLEGQVVGQALV